ncbi:MAG: CapA family protein, partial [Acutalibacteraceae bacterium]|nr:CapA family protein [Acutalibacteraceae bacterium]
VYSCKGRSIAFLSYTYGTNGISTPESADKRVIYTSETDIIKKQVKRANQLADIVIVGCHWGVEDSHVISDEQKKLAQNLADWGADLIVGTHPHVVQNAEWINTEDGRKVFCAYSLGNFISTQALADQVVGLVLDCTIDTVTTPDGKVTVEIRNPKLVPVVTVYGADFSNVHVVWYRDFTETDAMNHGVKISNQNFTYLWIGTMLKQYVNTDYLDLPDSTAGNALNGELSEEETTADPTATTAAGASTSATSAAASSTAATTTARTTAATTAATTTAAPTTAATTTGATVGEGRITNGPVGLPDSFRSLGFFVFCPGQRSTRRMTGISDFIAPVGQTSTHLRQVAQKVAALSAGTIGLTMVLNPRLYRPMNVWPTTWSQVR